MTQRQFPFTRLRRTRLTEFSRYLVEENRMDVRDLIYPIFVIEGQNIRSPIEKMPGMFRLSIDCLIEELSEVVDLGIPAIALFPVIDDEYKTEDARFAFDPNGLIPRAIRAVKQQYPKLGVISDVALDPYTSHGQDGIMNKQGIIANDETLQLLVRQALCQADAGTDIIAPSDMMDGRIGAIRKALEENHFHHTQILAYAAKYASCFYGPFRDAVNSSKFLKNADKKTYQMNPANIHEALHETALDIEEGADMVMIKPGLPYLDVVSKIKETFLIPTFVYQVSGEYAMIKAAAQNGWIDEKSAILESLLCMKRAGADAIITYYAKEAAKFLAK